MSFSQVEGLERRPWNSYWFVNELARMNLRSEDQTVLDFGCGPGVLSMRLARMGYRVSGFDISTRNIRNCQALARKYGLEERTDFSFQRAEGLTYADDSFDMIVGVDILHHVEIPEAIRQCYRTLKPGGLAVFREHLEVPAFDKLRNTALVKRFFTKDKSFKHHITADERKLNEQDLEVIRAVFQDFTAFRFTLLSRLDRFFRPLYGDGPSVMEQLDYFLINAVPTLGRLGGTIILALRKP